MIGRMATCGAAASWPGFRLTPRCCPACRCTASHIPCGSSLSAVNHVLNHLFPITARQGELGAEQAHATLRLGLTTHQHLPQRLLCWQLFACSLPTCHLPACGSPSNAAACVAATGAVHGSVFVPRCKHACTCLL